MSRYYLFGTLLTHYGSASLNHGKSKGNTSFLQKARWHNKLHSVVNSDAIRWALRFYWQQNGYSVNRNWDGDEFINTWIDDNYNPENFIDDDVLGFLNPDAVRREITEEVNDSNNESQTEVVQRTRTIYPQRLGALGVNRAFSLTPFDGGLTFNSTSGEKDNTSLHFIEFHNTRYQYVFALDCNHLKDTSRILDVLDGLMSIRHVGGHNNVFCYDFSPESFVLRWTQDPSPDMFYCFEQLEIKPGVYADPTISSVLTELVRDEDIDPDELWIGGKIAKDFELNRSHLYPGRKKATAELKKVIAKDLNLDLSQLQAKK
ncbi:MAG: DevR family CRISPR-associated autoregulator [Cyanobacteria bacterium P01_A01_bin.83]